MGDSRAQPTPINYEDSLSYEGSKVTDHSAADCETKPLLNKDGEAVTEVQYAWSAIKLINYN